jgi:hypothetical protein
VVVLAIGVQLVPPLVEDSQRITLPVFPLKVNVPLLLPEHTAASALTVPPTETGSTVIVAADEFAELQIPL